MRFSKFIIVTGIVSALLFASCDARKNLVGQWKVVSINIKKNRVLAIGTTLTFDPEGYITFGKGKAARGQWEITPSNKTLSLFFYGKALQHDVPIVGTFDFSSDRLTITDPKDETRLLIELEKLEQEPAQ